MDAEKLLSDILEAEVKSIMRKKILDEHTSLSEDKKRKIIKKLQRRSDAQLLRGVNDLSNKNIHCPESEHNPPTPFL